MQVTIHAAKTNLSKLIEAALSGEEVVIAKGKTPVVKLVPVPKRGFKFDLLKDKVKGPIPDFLSPWRRMNWPCGKVAIERRPARHSRPGMECFGQQTPQRPRAARDCGLDAIWVCAISLLRNWPENSFGKWPAMAPHLPALRELVLSRIGRWRATDDAIALRAALLDLASSRPLRSTDSRDGDRARRSADFSRRAVRRPTSDVWLAGAYLVDRE